MLRGPEVSSQAEDRGGGESPATVPHHSMNMHGSQVFFSSPLPFHIDAHWDGSRPPLELLHYISIVGRSVAAMLGPRGGISAHCGLLFVFARSCHIEPVSTGPWEIYTEPQVWGEAIRCAGDMLLHVHTKVGKVCVCVSLYTHCQSQLFPLQHPGFEWFFFFFWINFKQQR